VTAVTATQTTDQSVPPRRRDLRYLLTKDDLAGFHFVAILTRCRVKCGRTLGRRCAARVCYRKFLTATTFLDSAFASTDLGQSFGKTRAMNVAAQRDQARFGWMRKHLLSSAALLALSVPASAQTIDTIPLWNGTSFISSWGAPNTSTYGQTFTPTGVQQTRLNSFTMELSQGGGTAPQYQAFVDAYGFDLITWPGYPTLADYRELSMTLWLAGKASESESVRSEVRKRVRTIQTGGSRREWAPH